jgi:hypothetical protein
MCTFNPYIAYRRMSVYHCLPPNRPQAQDPRVTAYTRITAYTQYFMPHLSFMFFRSDISIHYIVDSYIRSHQYHT